MKNPLDKLDGAEIGMIGMFVVLPALYMIGYFVLEIVKVLKQ